MSRRFQGGESSEILNQSSVKNEDMIQCRHEVGTVNDSDKAIPLSVIQSCPVATCETAGGTAAKVGVVNNFSDFTLLNGREVLVYFASGNTADNPTFNLNNTGAFPLALENQLSTVSIGSGCWGDGVFLHLKYVDITVSNTRIQKWIICGHRIASQSSTQTIYADGQGRTNEVTSGNMQSVTSDGVKNALAEKVNTNIYTDTNLNTLINTGFYVVRMENQSPENLNFPVSHYGTVLVGTTPSGNLMQMFMSDSEQLVYVRNCTSNVWSGWVEVANALDELNIFDDTYYPNNFRFTVSNNFKGKIKVEVFDSNNTSIGSLDCIFYPGNILIKERNTVTYDISDNILTLYLPSSAYCKHYIHADIIQGSIVSANYI